MDGIRCNLFQIYDFPTSGDCEALELICMRGAPALTDPQVDDPYPVVTPVTFLVYAAPAPQLPLSPSQSIPPPPIGPVHPSPLRCLGWPRSHMPDADRGRGQGGCLGWSELALYVIVWCMGYWMPATRMVRLPCSLAVWIGHQAAWAWVGSVVGGSRSAVHLHRS